MLYFLILISFAEKPSKIPSDTKVGRELFQQHCQGCHQLPESEDSTVKNSDSEQQDFHNSEVATDENLSNDTPEEDSNIKTSQQKESLQKESLQKESHEKNSEPSIPLRSLSSNEIHIINGQSIPSITTTTYSNEDWLKWVLQGKGMMPSYSQVFHATDALKIKAYLDGL